MMFLWQQLFENFQSSFSPEYVWRAASAGDKKHINDFFQQIKHFQQLLKQSKRVLFLQ